MGIRRRSAALVTVLAVLGALFSPAVVAQAIAIPQVVGTPSGYDTNWLDKSLNANFTVDTPYSDSIQAPSCCTSYAGMTFNLPAGLSADLAPNGIITISGTPEEAAENFTLAFDLSGSDGTSFYITFAITVASNKAATATTVTTSTFSPYTGVNLTASVNAPSGGTVAFYLDDTLVGTTALLPVGTASYTGAVPESFVGSSPVVKAVYSGDATHAGSSSTSSPTVFIYGSRVLSGTFTANGLPMGTQAVRLLTAPGRASTGLFGITNTSGVYSITLPAPTTLAEATASYYIQADTGHVYSVDGGVGQPNQTLLDDATELNQSNWSGDLDLYINTAPTWADQTLAQPRLDSSYSDSVAASTTGTPSSITYTVTGDVPSWLTFSNGSFSALNPTDQDSHTFTVKAATLYGSIEKTFTLQAGDAGIKPTFTDETLATPQVGTAYSDGVLASGDATITYSSVPLPAGLSLDSATGAITGTPTAAGAHTALITATNDFGTDTFTWSVTVAAAPEIELTLDFAAGDTLGDAGSIIGASGLKVGSTYTLDMHSTPTRLFTGTVDATGGFSSRVLIPADTPAGAHQLILTGIAPNGTVMTATAWFSILADGTVGAVSYTGPVAYSVSALAAAGLDSSVPIGASFLLVVAGLVLLRRRRLQQA